jgi:hypothetical protein
MKTQDDALQWRQKLGAVGVHQCANRSPLSIGFRATLITIDISLSAGVVEHEPMISKLGMN